MQQFRVDRYVMDTLMPDLVLHDHRPSAFLVYLHLWYRAAGRRRGIRASHADIVNATGLSKSSVQGAIRALVRRRLVRSTHATATSVPEYTVLRRRRKPSPTC
jgi:hypothetical protein